MAIALALMLVGLVFGPTDFILDSFGVYFTQLPYLSFTLFPYEELEGRTSGWTLTYLIWWLA
jgi:glycine betaine transporter